MNNIRVSGTRFFIFRHAEAQKNIEKMHNGGTQDLTVEGVRQLIKSIDILKPEIFGRKVSVFYQREGRSKKTAEIIRQKLKAESKIAKQIYGVGLGVIANLNDDELADQYPEVSKILAAWKKNATTLKDYPDIPGREHMVDFANRIRSGLLNILIPETDIILVGTTSTINMLNHLMLMDGEFIRDKYDFISFPFSGINGWKLSNNMMPEKIFSNF